MEEQGLLFVLLECSPSPNFTALSHRLGQNIIREKDEDPFLFLTQCHPASFSTETCLLDRR